MTTIGPSGGESGLRHAVLGAAARRYLFYALLSALVGVAIAFLISFSHGGLPGWPDVASSALIGVCINTVIFAYDFLFALLPMALGRRADRSSVHQAPWKYVRIPAYFVGGVVGFVIGSRLSAVIFRQSVVQLEGPTGGWLVFMGILSIIVGSIIFAHESMRERLRDSVERLKEQEFAQKELEIARSIQRRLLPEQDIEGGGFRVAARNRAAQFVAGDFYDVFRLEGGDLGLVVADVAGKGVGASLIMASVKAMLPLVAAETSVAETLDVLNRRLGGDLSKREFVALAYARFSPALGRLEIGNAGLPDPLLLTADGAARAVVVEGERLPLAARRDTRYTTRVVDLAPGERLLMFSDGLAEREKASGETLGYEALEDLCPSPALAPGAWLDSLFDRLVEVGGTSTMEDDWTALLLEVDPSAVAAREDEREEVVGVA